MKLSIYVSAHGALVRSAESNTCYHITALILYPGFMHYNPQERDFLKKLTDYNMTHFVTGPSACIGHADRPTYPNG